MSAALLMLVLSALPLEVQSHPCADAAAHSLQQWHSLSDWNRRPRAIGGPLVFTSPTSQIGVWTEVHLSRYDELEVLRVDAGSTLTVRFGSDCATELEATTRETTSPDPHVLTDADLADLLREHQAGVVFVWSPHMPLSPLSLLQMREAAKRRDLPVFGVLDPFANEQAAHEAAEEHDLPEDDLRRLQSLELIMRNMTVHYPSAYVFRDGRLIGHMRLGYEEAYVYDHWLGQVLESEPE